MTKQTKLSEKPTRVPETRETQWGEIISAYLRDVEPLNSESARSHRFAVLVNDLLGIETEFLGKYVSGIETSLKVKQGARLLKGRADNLFGNVVIELEASLAKTRGEAEEQLRRYVAILWSREPADARTPYLCLAADGVRFIAYSPTLATRHFEPFDDAQGKLREKSHDAETRFLAAQTAARNAKSHSARGISPDDVQLQVIEDADWTKLQPREIYFWLDRYFLRKEILHPTSETIVRDFGVKSHAFQSTTRALLALWQEIKSRSAFAVVFDSWDKYLRIVYGTQVAGDELFIRHTYLATLAKVMAWMRISGEKQLPNDEQIVEMLEGRLFKKQGIENFIEEDFFSWLAREGAVKTGIGAVRWLFSLLQNYNLAELSEDVLKSLYQELVDPETRHDLGEVYTPDWLAHRIVNKLLDENPRGALLDPTCGSGTFLYLSIREKRARLRDSAETLRHILNAVCGADIHPLAVIVAKTNYILALGDLLKKRRGEVTIPIFLADTIKLPQYEHETKMVESAGEFVQRLPGYVVELDEREVHLPEQLLQDLAVYDQAIELAKEFAQQNKGKRIAPEPFRNFLDAQRFPNADNPALVQALFTVADALKRFIDADRDSIWAFVLKNTYKPLFFRRKFDFIVGNPPWLAYHFVQQPAYQTFLKKQIVENYHLLSGRGELITHIELATLFLVRAADLYLKSGGTIAFVLPHSLFSADQHDGLRKRSFAFSEEPMQSLFWREVWDCENVSPLFQVPACVLIADKREFETRSGATLAAPLHGQILHGKLERKNAALAEAENALVVEDVGFLLHTRGKRSFWGTGKRADTQAASYYIAKFAQGATIVPRSFWFVQVKPSPLGFNPDLPPLETATRAREQAKDAYKTVFFKDAVESRFLYATLLSTDLLPFGHLDYRLVVLPIEPEEDHYKLIGESEARKRGYLNLARWLGKAEKEWEKRRSAKAERIEALGWLDYRKKLSEQNPQTKYRVIYNASGTNVVAAAIENEKVEFKLGDQCIVARGFLVDYVTYGLETANRQEAFYVATVLNSPMVDKMLKPMQARGLWGPRHIVKKVLELPIPKFDAGNPTHKRLVELGKECSAKVDKWIASGGAGKITSIGKLRGMVRVMCKEELHEIDALVETIL